VIDQVPSAYSAIKIDGRRAYDLARQGMDVKLHARPITVSAFDVLAMRRVPGTNSRPDSHSLPNTASGMASNEAPEHGIGNEMPGMASNAVFRAQPATEPETEETASGNLIDLDVRVTCSAGTYIRALARDLGRELGVGGYLTALRRIRVGRFQVAAPNVVSARTVPRTYTNREGNEVTRNKAVLDCDADGLRSCAMPMLEAARAALPTIAITQELARDLRFGRRIAVRVESTTAAYVPSSGEVIALLEPVDAGGDAGTGLAKPVVVFPAD
jgi:tRNA pseudouridine55 synthase